MFWLINHSLEICLYFFPPPPHHQSTIFSSQVFSYSMFVSIMAFHAKISDPVMGGTYMTLLNTISNMAVTWAGTLALWLVDNVSFKDCEGVTDLSLDCDTMEQLKVCVLHVCSG